MSIHSNYSNHPICCVLGHVNVGKTKLIDHLKKSHSIEASNITQQLSFFNLNTEKIQSLSGTLSKSVEITDMTIIDTPGHNCFSVMRKIGIDVADVILIIIDITKGVEEETKKCLELVSDIIDDKINGKPNNKQIIFVLNKLDRIYKWKSIQNSTLKKSLETNKKIISELKSASDKIIYQLACLGINACLYYENKDIKNFMSMVPVSSLTGEGVPDLILLISKLVCNVHNTQNELDNRNYVVDNIYDKTWGLLNITLGKANRNIAIGDNILVQSNGINVETKIKKLVIKNKNKYEQVQSVEGTCVYGMILENNQQPLAIDIGSKCVVGTGRSDQIDSVNKNNLHNFKESEFGVIVCANTTTVMHGLYEILSSQKIPVNTFCLPHRLTEREFIRFGKTIEIFGSEQYKKDYMKKYFAVLVLDPQNVLQSLQSTQTNIRMVHGTTVFELCEKYNEYAKMCDKEFYTKYSNIDTYKKDRFELKILPQYVFLKTSPLLFGVKITNGIVRVGNSIVSEKNQLILGQIVSIQKNNKPVEFGEINDEICIKITNDKKITYGDDFDSSHILTKYYTNEEIDIMKFVEKVSQGLV